MAKTKKPTLEQREEEALQRVRDNYFRERIDELVSAEFQRYKKVGGARLLKKAQALFEKECRKQMPKLIKKAVSEIRFYLDE